jgi:signal transduction histidine kinase/DNA-binding response OmpR family regulator
MSADSITSEADPQKVNILLVDDRADKLLSLEVMLADLNQNLVRATSGRDALRCLLREDFAVILLDVNMPGMDGFETAALIRQRQRSETIPIIFVSAVNDADTHVSRGYSLGAVDYILSPIVPEILRAKVAVFVDLFKKTEEVKCQAEQRAREETARAEAEARQERLAFLAHAGAVLAGSLELQKTFQSLARLAVPRLAQFCVVHLASDEGELQPLAVYHNEAAADSNLKQGIRRFPGSHAALHAAEHIYRTGESLMFCETSEDGISGFFGAGEDVQVIRDLASSFMAVPIRARGRVLGTLTLINFSAARNCSRDELALAEDLAERAALAFENAGLYKAAQTARLDAERANKAKDNFLAMLSHELRTPLTPVLSSVLALEGDGLAPAEVQESLQMIRRNVELEARLIDDLLDLTRISKGKTQLAFELVDAHTLLRNALEICATDIEHKGIALRVELQAEHVGLKADPARLQQIFWNLIKNAVKFTPAGGEIRVTTTNGADGSFKLEVADTGIGIDSATLPIIFDAFEQGESATKGGLGLGLAISKALVEAHQGVIRAESDGRDTGARFTVSLPVSAEQPQIQTPRPTVFDGVRQALRVLLVEDHEDTNRSLTTLLRRRGYHVASALTAEEALTSAAAADFDVLVSDIGLPDGNGLDLMQKLSSNRPLFGIALTGFGMEDDIRKTRDVGFHHHLVKPVDLNKLDALIQEAAGANKGPAFQIMSDGRSALPKA